MVYQYLSIPQLVDVKVAWFYWFSKGYVNFREGISIPQLLYVRILVHFLLDRIDVVSTNQSHVASPFHFAMDRWPKRWKAEVLRKPSKRARRRNPGVGSRVDQYKSEWNGSQAPINSRLINGVSEVLSSLYKWSCVGPLLITGDFGPTLKKKSNEKHDNSLEVQSNANTKQKAQAQASRKIRPHIVGLDLFNWWLYTDSTIVKYCKSPYLKPSICSRNILWTCAKTTSSKSLSKQYYSRVGSLCGGISSLIEDLLPRIFSDKVVFFEN